MNKRRMGRVSLVLMLIATMVLLGACRSAEKTSGSTSNQPAETKTVKKEETPIQPTLYPNPLTGISEKTDVSNQRPVAVMINNAKAALPQMDIGKADIIYECNMEGGYTRLMCLFSHPELLKNLGSVRSSRDYFLDLAQNHDAIYFHAGGSPGAYAQIKARGIQNIDGVNGYIKNTFYRDNTRRKQLGYEHSLMINGEGIARAIEAKKYRTELKNGFTSPLHFAEQVYTPTQMAANDVKVKYSGYITAEFVYHSDTKLYTRNQFDKPHIDGSTGQQLAFTNVLVLFAPERTIAGDNKGRIAVDLVGSGSGYYITGGMAEHITWKKSGRDNAMTLWRENGEPLFINRGKSFISIAPLSAKKTTLAAQ